MTSPLERIRIDVVPRYSTERRDGQAGCAPAANVTPLGKERRGLGLTQRSPLRCEALAEPERCPKERVSVYGVAGIVLGMAALGILAFA